MAQWVYLFQLIFLLFLCNHLIGEMYHGLCLVPGSIVPVAHWGEVLKAFYMVDLYRDCIHWVLDLMLTRITCSMLCFALYGDVQWVIYKAGFCNFWSSCQLWVKPWLVLFLFVSICFVLLSLFFSFVVGFLADFCDIGSHTQTHVSSV